jgi:hypothetical protein
LNFYWFWTLEDNTEGPAYLAQCDIVLGTACLSIGFDGVAAITFSRETVRKKNQLKVLRDPAYWQN